MAAQRLRRLLPSVPRRSLALASARKQLFLSPRRAVLSYRAPHAGAREKPASSRTPPAEGGERERMRMRERQGRSVAANAARGASPAHPPFSSAGKSGILHTCRLQLALRTLCVSLCGMCLPMSRSWSRSPCPPALLCTSGWSFVLYGKLCSCVRVLLKRESLHTGGHPLVCRRAAGRGDGLVPALHPTHQGPGADNSRAESSELGTNNTII